eukprot:UN04843
MSLDLTRLKQIHDKHKHLAFGYIREMENELLCVHDNNIFYVIPELITITCLLFFNIDTIFEEISDKLIRSGWDYNTITKKDTYYWSHAAYGKRWIDSNSKNVYSWNIKIETKTNDIGIGIISNLHHQNTNQDFDAQHSYFYNLGNGWLGINKRGYGYPGFSCVAGDTVKFILNLDKLQLECVKNNEESAKKILCGDLITSEDVKYRLALSIKNIGDRVSVTANDDIIGDF